MNFFKSLLISVFISSFFVNNIFAVSNIETVLNKESIEFSEEKDEVISIFNNAFSETAEALKEMEITDVKNYKNNKMYKVYNIKMEEFNSGKKFNQLISKDYVWEVPIYNTSGEVVCSCTIKKKLSLEEYKEKLGDRFRDDQEKRIKEQAGSWRVVAIGNYIPFDWIEILSDRQKTINLIESKNIDNITDIKVISMKNFFSYILFIESNGEEYGIPVTKRSDLTGTENGKLYKMSDLISIYKENLNSPLYNSDGERLFGGGNGNTQETNTNYLLITLSILFGVFVIAFIVYKMKVNSKNSC